MAEKPPEYLALEPTLKEKGYVKNEDIRVALGVSIRKATRIAARLVALGWLRAEENLKARKYVRGR